MPPPPAPTPILDALAAAWMAGETYKPATGTVIAASDILDLWLGTGGRGPLPPDR